MIVTNGIANTVIGKVDLRLWEDVKRIAGIESDWDGKSVMANEWLVSEKFDAWHLNNQDKLASNEKGFIKTEVYITIRWYNFQSAIAKAEAELKKVQDWFPYEVLKRALTIAMEKYFDFNGQPKYIPDLLSPEDGGRSKTYGAMIKDVEAERKRLFNLYADENAKEYKDNHETQINISHSVVKDSQGMEHINDIAGRLFNKRLKEN